MSIKLNLKGWEDYIKAIQRAGGNVNQVCEKVIREDAQIMNEELKKQMTDAGVESHLIADMDAPEVFTEGNRFSARVGYKKSEYNPANPSNAYKVIFLNYGTPERTTKDKASRGKIEKKGFIQKAKRRAKTQITKNNKEAFTKIIEELRK